MNKKKKDISKISNIIRLLGVFLIFLMIFLSIKLTRNDEVNYNQPIIEQNYTDNLSEKVNKDTISFVRIKNLPSNFDTVPGGNNVFRSNQPTLTQLKSILSAYNIETVVRMNNTEGTGVSISSERNLVESMGKNFVWVNAHLGYKKDSGYVKSMDTIQPYLYQGSVLIHCTAGADRTGYQVARYLKDRFDWSEKDLWEYTTKYNYWENFICQGKVGYIKYMEGFYTLDKWCEEFGKKCNICK